MQSMRRAAFRGALSVSRAASAGLPQSTPFAATVGRTAVRVESAFVPATRCFSQTSRAFQDESNKDAEAQDGFVPQDIATGESAEPTTAASSTPGQHAPETETPHGVFIRNISFEVTPDHLTEAFSRFGNVTMAKIAKDARGLSRGYGFVWFDDAAGMNKAIAEVNGSFWHGRRVQASHRTGKTSNQRPTGEKSAPTECLYVGNIPYETSDAELSKMFQGVDNLVNVRVAVDRSTGWPRGFAHADFTDVEAAKAAFQKLSGFAMGGRQLRVDYAVPTNKGRFGPKAPRDSNDSNDMLD